MLQTVAGEAERKVRFPSLSLTRPSRRGPERCTSFRVEHARASRDRLPIALFCLFFFFPS